MQFDAPGTRDAYQGLPDGAAARCACPACRNFHTARPRHYDEAFRQLLASVGVDPRKEEAVRLVTPLEGDQYLYSGRYLLLGEIVTGRPHRGFPWVRDDLDVFEKLAPGTHLALRPWAGEGGVWQGRPCLRFEFLVALPWVIEQPGAPAVNLDPGPGRVSS